MKGDLPNIPRTYSDEIRYIVYVLYLSGFTLPKIGAFAGLRTKQVAGIVAKSEYTNRAAMHPDQRKIYLDELKAIRIMENGKKIDGGRLNDAAFVARYVEPKRNGR